MKKRKKLFSSPKGTAFIFAAAILLLLGSTIGGARAAVLYGQETFPRTIETAGLSVSLLEENEGTKGTRKIAMPAEGDGTVLLFEGMVPEGEKIRPGKKYAEKLGVKNDGKTAEYIRVTVYRYWARADENGNVKEKIQTIRPDYIRLGLPEAGGDWILDAEASAGDWNTDKTFAERTVFYYRKPLAGGDTVWFGDGLIIDQKINDALRAKENLLADGEELKFQVKVYVDAVQTHHAEDAVLSAWGRTVSIDGDGNLSLAGGLQKGEGE